MKPWMKLLASGAGAAIVASALAFHFEGTRYVAYQDIGGVWTICQGHTRGVKPGDVATPDQCAAYRADDVREAESTVDRCYPQPPTVGVKAALNDMAFNFGPGKPGARDGVCVLKNGQMPTIRKRALAGDWPGVCRGLLAWNKAGSRVLPGLTKRRQAAYELCIEGLP